MHLLHMHHHMVHHRRGHHLQFCADYIRGGTMPETAATPSIAGLGAHPVWDRICPGLAEHIADLREDLRAYLAGCPVADDVIQLVSELAANAVRHSRSGQPGGTFTAHVEQLAACAWGEV